MTMTEAKSKFLDTLISVKFFVILLSTAMFMLDKLSEDGWIMMILTTTGLRLVNEVGALVKEVKLAQQSAKAEPKESDE